MNDDTVTASKGPHPARIASALAYLVGLVWLFYQTWWLVVWYVWFRFDPKDEGLNLSAFGKAKAWTATGIVWVILIATAFKFAANLFSSRKLVAVFVRQVFSALVMLAIARWICGFTIVFGWHLPIPWDANYGWLPDYALIPVIAALVLFVLGSVLIPDFWGLPFWKLIPEPSRKAAAEWFAENFAPPYKLIPSGPQSPGTLGEFTSLWLAQKMRTTVLLYLMPIGFGFLICGITALLIFQTRIATIQWEKTNVLLHLIVFLVLPFLIVAFRKSPNAYWTKIGLWLSLLTVAVCWVVSVSAIPASAMGLTSCITISLCVVASAIAAVRVCRRVSNEFLGPQHDTQILGLIVDVGPAYEIYLSMFVRMLRPYTISLVLFAGLSAVAIYFDVAWLAIAWPLAALIHSVVFYRTVDHYSFPYLIKGTMDTVASDVKDFVDAVLKKK